MKARLLFPVDPLALAFGLGPVRPAGGLPRYAHSLPQETRNEHIRFNPSRITWARRRRGITKTGLAAAVGTDVRSIKAYEAGEFSPRPETARRIAQVLKFPDRFFSGDDLGKMRPNAASFRSMSKLAARARDMALGSAAVAIVLNQWLESRYALSAAKLPDLGRHTSPQDAAEAVRRDWGLGGQPIKTMVHLLEENGVRVFSLPAETAEAGAFSMWHQGRPLILLSTLESAEHQRFDAAHELGHLLRHRHAPRHGQKAEQDADAFASAFLMPAAKIRADAPSSPSLDQLIRLKTVWGVPPGVMAHRLHELGLLSDWQYRTLRIEIEERGEGKDEPAGEPRETSLMLQKVFAALRAQGITRRTIAGVLHIYPKDVDELAFGFALAGLDGSAPTDPNLGRLSPRLKVVSSKE